MFTFIQSFSAVRAKVGTRKKKVPAVGLVGMEVNEYPTPEQRQQRNVARMQRIQQKMDELYNAGESGSERFSKLKREMFIREGK